MWLEDHFGSGSMLQRNERVKLAASGGGILLRQAARHLDENRHCDSGASAWLALLLNRQQHFDLYAHSARRAPLGQRVLQMAGQPREAANRSCRAGRQELPA